MLDGLKGFFGTQTPEEAKAQARREQQLADQYGFDMLGMEQPFLDPVDIVASGAAVLPRGLLAALAEAGSDAVFSLAIEHGIEQNPDHLKAIYLGQRGMKAMGIDASRDLSGQFSGMHDKMVRMEVDNPTLTNPVTLKADKGDYVNLSDIADMPAINQAYPSIGNDITVGPNRSLEPGEATFAPGSSVMELGPVNPNKASDVARQETAVAHELQHAIDVKEGFPRGGSPDEDWERVRRDIERKNSTRLLKESYEDAEILALNKPTNKNKIQAEDAKTKYFDALAEVQNKLRRIKIGPENDYGNYRRLAGEEQARDAANRARLSETEKARTQPFSGAYFEEGDVKPRYRFEKPIDINDIIVDYNVGGGNKAGQGSVKPLDINDIPLD